MSDLVNDPAMAKLVEFAKKKGSVTFDEVKDMLPEELVNTEKLDGVYEFLAKQGIHIEEEDPLEAVLAEEEEEQFESEEELFGTESSQSEEDIDPEADFKKS